MNTGQSQKETAAPDSAGSELTPLLERLIARKENAYIEYIARCRKDECLGWEAKVDHGKFGENELKAHKDAQEMLGRHRAFADAIDMIVEAL